jgi:gliding motility-associated transport system ATP-binding protein
MVRVENLTKRYGSLLAVDNISFAVERGGVLGFLGPNGAGKTTTIRILSCYHPASGGTATVGGFDVFRQSMEVRRRVGYLPESTPLYPEMRVREYLQFRGKLRGMSREERMTGIRRVAERCWLGSFIDRPIVQLSKGMKQRVGLADAMLHDPDLLILDEPTIGLDPTQIRETRNLIKDLGDRHTVILSSHILHEVEQICDHTIIIASGKIVATGSPQELRNRFSEQGTVVAEVKADQADIEEATKNIAGVQNVNVSASNGWVRTTVSAESGCDVREDLFKLAKDKGWALRELRREGATLEDFFIKVTAEQQTVRPR